MQRQPQYPRLYIQLFLTESLSTTIICKKCKIPPTNLFIGIISNSNIFKLKRFEKVYHKVSWPQSCDQYQTEKTAILEMPLGKLNDVDLKLFIFIYRLQTNPITFIPPASRQSLMYLNTVRDYFCIITSFSRDQGRSLENRGSRLVGSGTRSV